MRGGSNGVGYERANSGNREARHWQKIKLCSEILSGYGVPYGIGHSYHGGPFNCAIQQSAIADRAKIVI
jgi:hypothetical protein